jgi:phosphatidylserine decarboxylase
MATPLRDWLENTVRRVKNRPLRWLSERYFFRDPVRPVYNDPDYFFSPADGIIIYQQRVAAGDTLIDIKGKPYSLRDAMRDDSYGAESLVIGIFMTLYDVHVNRIPYAGRLSYTPLPPLETFNHPMLDVERELLSGIMFKTSETNYLALNQRMLNRVQARDLGLTYHVLQIADYDVNTITPFEVRQNWPITQNRRFSQIRFGSQVDLIVPLAGDLTFETVQETGVHVEAGVDPLIKIGRVAPPHTGQRPESP